MTLTQDVQHYNSTTRNIYKMLSQSQHIVLRFLNSYFYSTLAYNVAAAINHKSSENAQKHSGCHHHRTIILVTRIQKANFTEYTVKVAKIGFKRSISLTHRKNNMLWLNCFVTHIVAVCIKRK